MNPDRNKRSLVSALVPLIAGYVCLHASMAGARMVAPLWALQSGTGNAAAGVLLALFSVSQIVLSIPAGRFTDRHGLRLPVGLSVVAASLGVGCAAAWPVYPVLCMMALLTGGALCTATIALQRHIGRMAKSTEDLKRAYSWYTIAPAVSLFLGPLVSGAMIDHGGYRAAFLLLALLPVLSWLLMRNAPEIPAEPMSQVPTTGALGLLRDARIRRLLLMNWLMTASWDLHGFMVPVMGHERGLTASVIGAILATFAFAASLVRVAMPLFAARMPEWLLITVSTAVAGLVFVLYPWAGSAVTMGWLSFLGGTALGVVTPIVLTLLHHYTPAGRQGEALALRIIMINISGVCMPVLFGAMGGVLGASVVFWVTGAAVALGSRLGLGLRGTPVDTTER